MTPNRARLFDLLSQLLDRYPEFRFAQLVCNLADWSEKHVWDIEDDELVQSALDHLARVAEREKQVQVERS